MRGADITNLNRAAMWCAQVGHEYSGLLYTEEIADRSEYEGREDLGNTKRLGSGSIAHALLETLHQLLALKFAQRTLCPQWKLLPTSR